MGATVAHGRRFTWDDAKRRAVRREHGLDRADRPEAFGKPTIELEPQPDTIDGWRYKILGLARRTIVIVVYTERSGGDEIRLITAWRANKSQQTLYYREVFGERF